jgi:transposase InsO family protein
MALAHPSYGCNRFEAMLALEGVRVSSITIQKLLNDNGLGRKSDRWLALEQTNADKRIELTPEQATFIEKLNPCFLERHVESSAPGELLSAGTFFVGSLKGIGRVYLHAVVDTYGSYAFGFLYVSKQPEAAVASGTGVRDGRQLDFHPGDMIRDRAALGFVLLLDVRQLHPSGHRGGGDLAGLEG